MSLLGLDDKIRVTNLVPGGYRYDDLTLSQLKNELTPRTPEYILKDLGARDFHIFFDDFEEYVSGDKWTLVTAVDGTATIADAANGVVDILSSAGSAAGNEDTYLKSNKETWKFDHWKTLVFEARVKFTEGFTNQANVIIGLLDAVAADALQDNGAGPKASYSGAVFFKVDGETNWQVESSIAGDQVTEALTAANADNLSGVTQSSGGGVWQKLKIVFETTDDTSGTGNVHFYINDVLCATNTISYNSATEMQIILGVKDGDANDEETISVDYVFCAQVR